MHRFSSNPERTQWLSVLNLKPENVKSHHCVCSPHLRHGDTNNPPMLHLGKKLRSPKKLLTPHGLRASKRQKLSTSPTMISPSHSPSPIPSTPILSDTTDDDFIPERELMTTSESDTLVPDFSIIDLPGRPCSLRQVTNPSSDESSVIVNKALLAICSSRQVTNPSSDKSSVIVNKALLARIEILEAELKRCEIQLQKQEPRHFRIENIASNDSLISFYTGFPSYEVFLCFFEFLGPSVHCLNYWGDKETTKAKKKKKLDPKNRLFLRNLKKIFGSWYAQKVKECQDRDNSVANVHVDLRTSAIKPVHFQWLIENHSWLAQQEGSLIRGWKEAGIMECIGTLTMQ